jgi:4-diphosphocytidyl-2-C-methyl-D-erythritol kinase
MRVVSRKLTRSHSSVVIQAPAKLNLFLEILGRRSDGFHELETLMATVSIRDTLEFTATSDPSLHLDCHWSEGLESHRIQLEKRNLPGPQGQAGREAPTSEGKAAERVAAEQVVAEQVVAEQVVAEREVEVMRATAHSTSLATATPWESLPPPEDNLVLRALDRLRRQAGVELGARVRLSKRIPSAAGLGGASSDAAAALWAANLAWQLDWSTDQLACLAAELGSDIPFFFSGGVAVCRGRGEEISELDGLPVLDFVVVRPAEGLSTADVYRRCRPADVARCSSDIVNAWRRGDRAAVGRLLHNGLQEPARQLSPAISQLQTAMEACGVLGHQLSGSGTSYFGLCRHVRHARQVAGRLRSQGLGAVYCASSECSFVSGARQTSGP